MSKKNYHLNVILQLEDFHSSILWLSRLDAVQACMLLTYIPVNLAHFFHLYVSMYLLIL